MLAAKEIYSEKVNKSDVLLPLPPEDIFYNITDFSKKLNEFNCVYFGIKEETKNEKNPIIAFDAGYTKSRTTILDANITTLIAAFILFFMGSGPVKGFSVTLGVGILTTLFSVYFIARLLTSLYVVKNKDKEQLL